VSTTNPQSDAPHDDAGVAQATPAGRAKARRRSKQRRRLANVAGLLAALVLTGTLYSFLAPANAADDLEDSGLSAEERGRELYENSCISCHGENLEGVPERGPSLIGVGEAAVYFQVHTGRMPLVRQEADAPAKPAVFSDEEIDWLMAYVQANGGGPTLPSGDLRDGDLAEGGELFRLNCASCHNFTGRGGALSSGKYAPQLDPASETQIYTAMLTGPQNMPKFSDRQLTPEEKEDIIAYIKSVSEAGNSVGGYDAGGIGPTAEGIVAFIFGLAAMVGIAIWLGAKA
jgi:ubiquinol-cytochrome c reductase cytochrome c subunit